MSSADRKQRSIRNASVVTVLLVGLGIVGFLVVRNGRGVQEGAELSGAGPLTASQAPRPTAAPSAPANVASIAVAAVPASSGAAGAAPPWHATLQPAVVAATRVESLAPLQVQMERWTCEGQQCVGNFRIPPTVAASHNIASAAQIFDSLKQEMAKEDVNVALSSMQPGPQGLAVSFQFMPNAAVPRRTYTDTEITAIRAESFDQGLKAAAQEPAVQGRGPAH